MNTQPDQTANKNLAEYSLITFESELDEGIHINFGDRETFKPTDNTIECIRKEAENLISESISDSDWGDGFYWDIKYAIYGLPANTPTDTETLKNRNKWELISREKFRIIL